MSDVRTRVVEPFVAAAREALPGASAVAYGSLVRGDLVEGLSDLNLLLVAPDLDPAALDRLAPAVRRWRGAGYPPPLLFPAGEWDRAIDVFQVELADIRSAYEVLLGADPIAGHEPQPALLRRVLEQDFRGKLMRMRQGYATVGNDAEALGAFAVRSVSTALVLMRALLALHGERAPVSRDGLLTRAEARVGATLAPVGEVARHRTALPWACTRVTFLAYLAAVEAAAHHVDRFDPLAGGAR